MLLVGLGIWFAVSVALAAGWALLGVLRRGW